MGNFITTDLGVSSMTQEQLDHIALNQKGVVGHFSGGYDRWETQIQPRLGYRFKVVGSHGCGNRGKLVLLPTNKRTFALLRQGRINWIKEEFQVNSITASILVDNMFHSYCHEYEVLKTAIDTWDYPSWEFFSPERVRAWAEEWNWGTLGMSVPRFIAVYHLVKALRQTLCCN